VTDEKFIVAKYRLGLALLAGTGLTAFVALLLNVPSFPVTLLASFLLVPGGIVGALVFKSQGLGSPLPILIANALLYSAVDYSAIHFWLRLDVQGETSDRCDCNPGDASGNLGMRAISESALAAGNEGTD
jgi:hypothetical protein